MKMDTFDRVPGQPQRKLPRGFELLSRIAAEELFAAVSHSQARGFFVAVGRRVAAQEKLEGVESLDAVSRRINAFWRTLDWGEADIELQANGVMVRHHCPPSLLSDDADDHWRVAVLAVLEGVYDSWFREMGSGPALKTLAGWNGEVVELRHGP